MHELLNQLVLELLKSDIPLKDFTNAGLKSLADLNQLIITSTPFGSGIAFIDNIYYTTSTTGVDEENGANAVDAYPNPIRSE